ncbi:MAG TPA: DMT family transporter [Nitrososphaeraceae archaeon]|nr:DMT family transporter [Nitrososphaeraceae archaeon]
MLGLRLNYSSFVNSNIINGYASAIVAAILFGGVSTIGKPIVSTVDPLLLSAIIYLIAGLFFTPLAARTSSKITRKTFFLIVVSAVSGAAIAPIIFFQGLKMSTAADTALLANGETVFSILFALLIFRERLKPVGYIAVTLILSGVFLVTTNLDFNSSIFSLNVGNVLVILATCIWGFDNNICKIIARQIHISKLIQLKALIGGTILIGMAIISGIPFSIHSEQLIPIILLSVFGFAISLYLYLHSIKRIGVIKASSLLSLSAVFGVIFAIIFLRESINVNQIIAISVMIFGVHLMYTYEKKNEIILK